MKRTICCNLTAKTPDTKKATLTSSDPFSIIRGETTRGGNGLGAKRPGYG